VKWVGQHCSEFGLQNGTTYNSFIIEGDKLAVVDASHEKFRDLYLSALKEEIDPSNIEYILATAPLNQEGLCSECKPISHIPIANHSKVEFLHHQVSMTSHFCFEVQTCNVS
jgi:flavorubredoxin